MRQICSLLILTGLFTNAMPSYFDDDENFDVCVSVRKPKLPPQRNSNYSVNRPGKMGPRGPRGFKGDIGPPGSCVCDQRKQQKLQIKLDRLEELYIEMKPADIYFKYTENPDSCSVGLENRQIPDSSISASSHVNSAQHHGPHLARLNNTGGKIWAPANGQIGEWIQVDLGSPTTVTGIITQGRKTYAQWITSFRISYGNSINSLRFVQNQQGGDKIFVGNHDRTSYKTNAFVPSITARYLRYYVVSYSGHACLRMEYLKC